MRYIASFFHYIENLWIGRDGKPSLRNSLAIALSINFMLNLSHAIYKWELGRSLSELAIVLGIESGLIIALLGLSTMQNIQEKKFEEQTSRNDSNNAAGNTTQKPE